MIDKQQGPNVQHRELSSNPVINYNGKENFLKRECLYVYN